MPKLIEPEITKGEWFALRTAIKVKHGNGTLVAATTGYTGFWSDEREANARFIAAAPRVARAAAMVLATRGDCSAMNELLNALLAAGYREES